MLCQHVCTSDAGMLAFAIVDHCRCVCAISHKAFATIFAKPLLPASAKKLKVERLKTSAAAFRQAPSLVSPTASPSLPNSTASSLTLTGAATVRHSGLD